MLNGKAKAALEKVGMNRNLNGAKTKSFSHVFPGWQDSKKMTIVGVETAFNQVFTGFEHVNAVRNTFGKSTDKVLSTLKIAVYNGQGYAWIDTHRGRLRLMMSRSYLQKGRKIDIYLDVVHELTHIKQYMEGRDLWDEKYDYVDRPTEIEAYRKGVAEAKRLGMSKKEIASYLYVKWLSNEHFERLLKAVNV